MQTLPVPPYAPPAPTIEEVGGSQGLSAYTRELGIAGSKALWRFCDSKPRTWSGEVLLTSAGLAWEPPEVTSEGIGMTDFHNSGLGLRVQYLRTLGLLEQEPSSFSVAGEYSKAFGFRG